jgi:hypothetical protein
MRLLAAALVLAALAAAPARAQELVLGPEEAVTLRIGADAKGGFDIAERGRAQWTAHDLAVARNFVTGAYDEAVGNNTLPLDRGTGIPEAPPVVPGAVRLRFLPIAGRHSELIVENGYDDALVYRATITVAGASRPTDVCVVTPHNRAFEHWPQAIERIVLTDIRLIPWEEGRRITCE